MKFNLLVDWNIQRNKITIILRERLRVQTPLNLIIKKCFKYRTNSILKFIINKIDNNSEFNSPNLKII